MAPRSPERLRIRVSIDPALTPELYGVLAALPPEERPGYLLRRAAKEDTVGAALERIANALERGGVALAPHTEAPLEPPPTFPPGLDKDEW